MSYIGDSINASPTIAERAGAAIPGGAGLAVKYDVATCVSGGAVSKGALVAVNASAQAVAAGAGDFAIGMALSGAAAAGQMVQVQICKCGFVPEAK